MAQTLFMVLVDTAEATPREIGEKIKKFMEDTFSGTALTAMGTVLAADEYDVDGSDGMELIDELFELQSEIEQAKN